MLTESFITQSIFYIHYIILHYIHLIILIVNKIISVVHCILCKYFCIVLILYLFPVNLQFTYTCSNTFITQKRTVLYFTRVPRILSGGVTHRRNPEEVKRKNKEGRSGTERIWTASRRRCLIPWLSRFAFAKSRTRRISVSADTEYEWRNSAGRSAGRAQLQAGNTLAETYFQCAHARAQARYRF